MKPFGNETIKNRFQLLDDSIQTGLRENPHAPDDGNAFSRCQPSYAHVIAQDQRGAGFARTSHDRASVSEMFGVVRLWTSAGAGCRATITHPSLMA